MSRPRSLVLLWMFVIIGELAVIETPTYDPRVLLVFLIVAAWYTNATSVNDLSDEEVDKINLQNDAERPLVEGSFHRRHLIWLALGTAVIALGVAALINLGALLLVAIALVLNCLYSLPPFKISYRGLWAQLLLPLGYVGLTFLLGAGLHRYSLTSNEWLLLASLYVSFIGRLLLKDFRDVTGDRQVGKRTFLVRHGHRATCLTAAVAWVAGDLLLSWTYHADYVFIVLLQIFTIAVLAALFRLSKEELLHRQLLLIALAGRFANGAGILLLANMSLVLQPQENAAVILGSITIVLLATAHPIYTELKQTEPRHQTVSPSPPRHHRSLGKR